MKHAYLIMAHKNKEQLINLVSLINNHDNEVIISIDKKANFDINDLPFSCDEHVHVYKEQDVHWGGLSQVKNELFIFEKSIKYNCDYYHLMSGQDLPLVKYDEFDAFFEKNKGKEFIEIRNSSYLRDAFRLKVFHLLDKKSKIKRISEIEDVFAYYSMEFQNKIGINRINKNEYLFIGSNWVSVTHKFVKELVGRKKELLKKYKYTRCPDEVFVQNIIGNENRFDECYKAKGFTSNARFIDWERSENGSNPYIFRKSDFEQLINSGCAFARKFDSEIDNEIINMITNYVKNGKR